MQLYVTENWVFARDVHFRDLVDGLMADPRPHRPMDQTHIPRAVYSGNTQ